MSDLPLIVTNDQGTSFRVTIVRKGDRWGRNDCLVHDNDEPLIEFYDQTYAGDPRFGERGQFVANYYLSTLREPNARRGIDLSGGVPAWRITAENLADVLRSAAAAQRSDST